jgi:hypothetical protein
MHQVYVNDSALDAMMDGDLFFRIPWFVGSWSTVHIFFIIFLGCSVREGSSVACLPSLQRVVHFVCICWLATPVPL